MKKDINLLVSEKIAKLVKEGKSRKQAVAIALDMYKGKLKEKKK